MNIIKNILVFSLVLFLFNCKNEAKPEIKTIEVENDSQAAKEVDPNATFAKAEFTIDGMTCAMGCAKTIEKKISGMDGVKSATVDFDRKLAMVEFDDATVTTESLTEMVAKAGDMYKVKDMKTVEYFSTAKKECTCKCKPNCDVKDCPDCKAKKEACKGECAKKAKGDKMVCAENCDKPCCSEKEKA